MTALSFVWLGLLVLELTRGLSEPLEIIGYVIWGLFVFDFAIEFTIAPHKWAYLKRNVLTAVSLLLPAVRVVRVLRVFRSLWVLRFARTARTARSVRLVRVLSSVNRGVRATSSFLGRRGAGYVVAATILVVFAGAAGMNAFENPRALREAGFDPAPRDGLDGYGEAVWWTAMIMTTMGSQYWPQTVEGRMLCFFLSLYAFGAFGYITATIASYFVAKGSDEVRAAGEGGSDENARQVLAELAILRREVAALAADRLR